MPSGNGSGEPLRFLLSLPAIVHCVQCTYIEINSLRTKIGQNNLYTYIIKAFHKNTSTSEEKGKRNFIYISTAAYSAYIDLYTAPFVPKIHTRKSKQPLYVVTKISTVYAYKNILHFGYIIRN